MARDVLTINQNDLNGADIEIKLVDGQELRIKRTKNFTSQEHRINLLALNDKSKRRITFGWKWFLVGIVTSLLLIPQSIHQLVIPDLYLDVAFYAGFIISIYCFYLAWETTTLRQFFYSFNTNTPVIELAVGKPSKKEFDDFLKKAEKSIRTYRESTQIDPSKQIKGEMKTLRRLSESGAINGPEYEYAKALLLKKM